MKEESRNVLFYSSVSDKLLFNKMSFYSTDISLLGNLGFNVILSNDIRDFFKYKNYDFVFIYFYRKGVLGSLIARIFGKRVFFSGGIDYLDANFNTNYYKRILQRFLFSFAYQLSHGCNIVSISDLENTRRIIPNDRKLYYFPHSIDVMEFASNDLVKRKVITTVCWMGSIENVKRKGLIDVVDVFYDIWIKDPDYQLVIIGTKGVGTEYLLKYMDERSIPSKCILFTGGISDNEKISILKYSKFYFQFSKYEGFGVAALEALASRNIVIHSGKGGLKDTLLDYGYNVGWPINKSRVTEIFEKYQAFEGYDLFRYNNYILNYLNRSFSHSIRLDNLFSMIIKQCSHYDGH